MISGNVGVGLKEDINTGEYTEMIITILIKGRAIYIQIRSLSETLSIFAKVY